MDNIVELDYEEYVDMHNKLKGNIRVVMSEIGISPYDSKEERELKIYKAFNPDLPRQIQMYTREGITIYRPKRGKKC